MSLGYVEGNHVIDVQIDCCIADASTTSPCCVGMHVHLVLLAAMLKHPRDLVVWSIVLVCFPGTVTKSAR
jgi:hypothetical protein